MFGKKPAIMAGFLLPEMFCYKPSQLLKRENTQTIDEPTPCLSYQKLKPQNEFESFWLVKTALEKYSGVNEITDEPRKRSENVAARIRGVETWNWQNA